MNKGLKKYLPIFFVRLIFYFLFWTIFSNLTKENPVFLNSSFSFVCPIIIENSLGFFKGYKLKTIILSIFGVIILWPIIISIYFQSQDIIFFPLWNFKISRMNMWVLIYIYALSPTIND